MRIKNLRKIKKAELIKIIREMEIAIKKKCFECMSHKKIDCEAIDCGLYKFRPWSKYVSGS